MTTEKPKSLEEKFLRKFRNGKKIDQLKDQHEIQFFQVLQRFDLIRAGAAGKFRTTVRGEDALSVGVNKYLSTLRLEKKLLKDFAKNTNKNRWMVIFGILALLFLLFFFLYFQ